MKIFSFVVSGKIQKYEKIFFAMFSVISSFIMTAQIL